MSFYNSKLQSRVVDQNHYKQRRIKLNQSDTKPPTPFEIVWLFFNYVFLIAWALIILFPIVSLIVSSFNVYNYRYVSLTPFTFGFDNFRYLFIPFGEPVEFMGTGITSKSYFLRWYGNTLFIAALTTIVSTAFVALNGYAYSRFRFAGSKHSLTIIMMIQMIPATSSLICLYMVVQMGGSLGVSPIFMLVIIYSGQAITGNTFMLKSYLDTVSTELDDSAKVDGCSNWGLFFKILIPVIKPTLVMTALWSFLIPFTDVILPKFVIFELKDTTLAVGLDTFLSTEAKQINAGAYAAGALLAALPAFALFMYLQRYIVGGLSEGAVKG
ncbi:ABC transporter permease subunit [Mycoplasmopsis alligatoris]|uniref:ABC transporter, permease protein n=1 Tax=Mycoplasmopsis alligatoris A21JP2 TaxID=747682 RepID=D4XWN9_9BACT|nr:ABC transporter permease subunit [Mycoplasmopsis alligatoris]EFF41254.1 ABC transporter, permease protein [Mycoplasmopsis alligatoris A21JP2]